MYAHSYSEDKNQIIPYNLSIDATIEYRIVNPLIIYYIENLEDYIKNKVHMFLQKSSSIDLQKLQELLNKEFKYEKNNSQGVKKFLINRILKKIQGFEHGISLENEENGLIIEKVIISSYDNLISHRATQ